VYSMVATRASPSIDSEYLGELAWWILWISGGHPRNICDVLGLIESAGFVFPNLEYTFRQHPFTCDSQTGTLFDLCVKPTINEMLETVSPPLRDIMALISPLRRFDQELLVELFDESEMAPPEYDSSWKLVAQLVPGYGLEGQEPTKAKYQAVWELIRQLRRKYLISPPTAGDPMFSGQIIHNMLSVQLQIHDLERWKRVHSCVQRVFDRLINGLAPVRNAPKTFLNGQARRSAIGESLYHLVQIHSDSPADLPAQLDATLKSYLERLTDIGDILQLKDTLSNDSELADLVARWAGKTVMSELIDLVGSFSTL